MGHTTVIDMFEVLICFPFIETHATRLTAAVIAHSLPTRVAGNYNDDGNGEILKKRENNVFFLKISISFLIFLFSSCTKQYKLHSVNRYVFSVRFLLRFLLSSILFEVFQKLIARPLYTVQRAKLPERCKSTELVQ